MVVCEEDWRDSGSGSGGLGGTGHGLLRYYLLYLLSAKDRYGYEMMTLIRERTRGAWSVSSGALYPLLKRMERDGLVVSGVRDGKKFYSITERGRESLAAARERLARILENWEDYAQLLEDFVGKEQVASLVLSGYRRQFQVLMEIIESGQPPSDIVLLVSEELESQLRRLRSIEALQR